MSRFNEDDLSWHKRIQLLRSLDNLTLMIVEWSSFKNNHLNTLADIASFLERSHLFTDQLPLSGPSNVSPRSYLAVFFV